MTDGAIEVREDDLAGEQIKALLRLHLDGMHRNSPHRHVFALDLSGLKSPGVNYARSDFNQFLHLSL